MLVLVLGINVGVSVCVIGPLQVSIDVVQNRHIGTQTSHWDKTNKGNYHLELVLLLVLVGVTVSVVVSIGVIVSIVVSVGVSIGVTVSVDVSVGSVVSVVLVLVFGVNFGSSVSVIG